MEAGYETSHLPLRTSRTAAAIHIIIFSVRQILRAKTTLACTVTLYSGGVFLQYGVLHDLPRNLNFVFTDFPCSPPLSNTLSARKLLDHIQIFGHTSQLLFLSILNILYIILENVSVDDRRNFVVEVHCKTYEHKREHLNIFSMPSVCCFYSIFER